MAGSVAEIEGKRSAPGRLAEAMGSKLKPEFTARNHVPIDEFRLAAHQFSGWPTRAALRPISGVCSEKIEANQPGLGTIEGLKALQPAFISAQVPSWHSLLVSLVARGRGRR